MRIAFLGLGRMGRELALHLPADHEVTVWNRTEGKAAELVEAGATLAPTAAAAVDSADVVITALFGADAVGEVVLDGDLPLGPDTVWIDITTVSPDEADQFTAWAASSGIAYAHSPVIGSLAPARAKKLGVLIGGVPRAIGIATPIVSTWADPARLRTYDTARKAAADKLANNLTVAVAMQGFVEALRVARSGGLSLDEALAALDHSALAGIKNLKAESVRSGDFSDTQFSAALLAKDSRLMVHTSTRPLPALTAVHAALDRAVKAGRNDDDFAVIAADDC